eukprot:scaffold20696_cov112-Isochrysis_galbana.AAC.2
MSSISSSACGTAGGAVHSKKLEGAVGAPQVIVRAPLVQNQPCPAGTHAAAAAHLIQVDNFDRDDFLRRPVDAAKHLAK